MGPMPMNFEIYVGLMAVVIGGGSLLFDLLDPALSEREWYTALFFLTVGAGAMVIGYVRWRRTPPWLR